MKIKLIILLLAVSISINLYILGKYLLVDQWYKPSGDENTILSEMVQKTVESNDYERISDKEDVIAINTSMDKFKGGAYPYYFEVSVSTNKQTYLFYCKDDNCSQMELGGTTYSVYEDEAPRLPFNK